MATKLTRSLETGLRPIELHNLKVKDIDTEQRLVYPKTAKNGSPKTLKIKRKSRHDDTRPHYKRQDEPR